MSEQVELSPPQFSHASKVARRLALGSGWPSQPTHVVASPPQTSHTSSTCRHAHPRSASLRNHTLNPSTPLYKLTQSFDVNPQSKHTPSTLLHTSTQHPHTTSFSSKHTLRTTPHMQHNHPPLPPPTTPNSTSFLSSGNA
eukprot:3933456-Rhodomonas_salina.1